jgi:predicted  nucleic acid-binding Zn-ribbon protein
LVFPYHDQELKEYSRRKSLFIRDESGVWAALARQRALVEEAQKRLSDRNAEMAELCIAYAAVKEEVVQAWATEAVAREDVTKAREEAARARKDLEPRLARVKELEEVTARFGALKDEIVALNGAVQEKDATLQTAHQEIEALRVTICDRDDALQGLKRTCGGLRDEVVGLQTHTKGKYGCYGHGVEAPC